MSFGATLKTWRNRRRLSQLDLGLSANVSSRHISFLETGRAQPSRGMVLRLCEELELPRAARNQLLFAAGLAPAYGSRSLADEEMRPVREAVDWLLQRHAPFPAMALDRHWHLVQLNRPAGRLFAGLGLGEGDSMLTALIQNERLRAALENLEEVLQHTIARLRTESAHLGGDPILEAAIEALQRGLAGGAGRDPGLFPAFVPARLHLGGKRLSLFSTVAQFGTAEDVALSELKLELLFPADADSKALLVALEEDDLEPPG